MKNILITSLIVFLQIVLSFILGFSLPFILGIGNGWEVLAIPLGISLGIWLPGVIKKSLSTRRFLATFIPAIVLMLLINFILPPMGYRVLILPIIGAFLGYYLSQKFLNKSVNEKP